MIVLDASAVLELLLGTPNGQRVAHRIAPADETLHAPHLLDVEVAQVLRRYVAAASLTPEAGQRALDDLADLDVTRYAHDLLLPRIWELRGNLTAYAAAYVSLAEVLDAPLLTFDVGIANAPGHAARIEQLG